jgi:cell fate regulator YaaT (PSP1 superfamily)
MKMPEQEVIDVRVKSIGKVGPFLTRGISVKRGLHCIVETERGIELAVVVRERRLISTSESSPPLNVVIREATLTDVDLYLENKEKEKTIFGIVKEQIALHDLPMKLIKTELLLDGSKVVVYYTADGRVDFRELLKSLVKALRCRVELRQIGTRDAAKMLGGIGICGRMVCCCTFLQDFGPVSLKSSRKNGCCQNLSRLSGACGKLRCCYAYEEARLVQIDEEGNGLGCEKELNRDEASESGWFLGI